MNDIEAMLWAMEDYVAARAELRAAMDSDCDPGLAFSKLGDAMREVSSRLTKVIDARISMHAQGGSE